MAGDRPHYSGDPLTAGLNSTRGAAADTIGRLLFADPARWAILRAAVEGLVRDPSTSVRAMTAYTLLPVLRIDRDAAVRMFLELGEGDPVVRRTRFVEEFVRHATWSHYTQLRPLLLDMLREPTMKLSRWPRDRSASPHSVTRIPCARRMLER